MLSLCVVSVQILGDFEFTQVCTLIVDSVRKMYVGSCIFTVRKFIPPFMMHPLQLKFDSHLLYSYHIQNMVSIPSLLRFSAI